MPTWLTRIFADPGNFAISVGGLILSLAAFWRSGRVRVLDRRTELLKDIADLQPRLEVLEKAIPDAAQSRERAQSAVGGAHGGAVIAFKQAGLEDCVSVGVLRADLETASRLPFFTTYRNVEARIVAARGMRTRYEQLEQKYAAAAREDAATRDHIRRAWEARGGVRPISPTIDR